MAKQFIDLADLSLFKNLNDSATAEAIRVAEARSLHTVAIEGTTLKFYREEEPVGSATPAYSITLPQQDLSNYLQKIASATEGNVVIAHADGTVADGGVALSALARSASLAAVATSGKAADVAIDDEGGLITATTVEGALAELAQASAGGVASKTVYVVETSGQTGDVYSKQYSIYQGATGSSASPVASEKLVDINIPKDMFIESGSVGTVTTPDVPYEGAVVGDKYIDLVLANAESTHIYIPANRLVDIYTAQQSATQIQLTIDSNNVISAEIVDGSVDTDALGALAVTTAKIADEAVTEAKLSQEVQDKLNASAGVTAVAEGTTNGTVSVTTDGTTADVAVHGLGSAAYTDSTAYDAAGAAATAKNEVIGESTDTATDNTIYGAKAYALSVAGDATEAVPEADIRNLFAQSSI